MKSPDSSKVMPDRGQVYRSMKDDPAYTDGRMSVIEFKDNIFGYTMAAEKDGDIFVIGGEGDEVPRLHIGTKVKLKGEYAELGGLHPDDETEIIGFCRPFMDGETDHIVVVRQGEKVARLKPYQMEKLY